MARILVIEDEKDIQDVLDYNLRQAGHRVQLASTGKDGLKLARERRPDVVLLDLMLPDVAGTEVCKALKQDPATRDAQVMMLTAKGEEIDRVIGFELGADDYVVKPFSVRELVMRVRGLARRPVLPRLAGSSLDALAPLRWRGIELDATRHRTSIDGAEIVLRPLEFKLLHVFMRQPGHLLSRAQLLEDVWGVTGEGSTRTVDTHVRRLRDRIRPYADAIETVHGFGYRLREPETEPQA